MFLSVDRSANFLRDFDMKQHSLDILLRPRSIAFVGASDRPNSPGLAMIEMCLIDGFDGKIFLVNPRLKTLNGMPCYSDLTALPETPDHVVIGVASRFVEEVFDQALGLGVKAATIFASCYLDDDTRPGLPARIAAKASSAGMHICGANCMGFYNPYVGLRVASAASPSGLQKGGITWIAQSGSAFGALSHNDRRLGFNLVVSTGMEIVTSVADYMEWALLQPETRVVGLFIETIRNAAGFIAALETARNREIPVVVLKVGRTLKSAQMALSHTGAIAGNDAVYEAVFRAYGVHRVGDLDEMAATLAMFDTPRKPASGRLGAIHDSGGERELLVDLAEDYGFQFAELTPETCSALQEHLEPGLVAENPLDAFGTHNNLEDRFASLIATLVSDVNVGLGLFMSNPRDGYAYAENYSSAMIKAAQTTDKPLALATNYSMADDRKIALRLKEAGVPLLRGTRNALLAAGHFMADREFRGRQSKFGETLKPKDIADETIVAGWKKRLKDGRPLSEADGFAMLSDFGLAVPNMANVDSLDDLEAAIVGLNFPLVIKTAEDFKHKSDVGGVKMNIFDPDDAKLAYAEMSNRLGPKALLMEMTPADVEISFGAIYDEGFGMVVIVSAGGVLIELLNDNVAALAPFNSELAKDLLTEMSVSRLLSGYRGRPAADIDGLALQLARFSRMVALLGNAISEIDINPVTCGPDGAFAVDFLLVPKANHSGDKDLCLEPLENM